MINNSEHEKLCNEIHLEVGSMKEVRLFKRKVGKAVPVFSNSGRPIQFGLKGEADLQGIISPFGRAIAIEVKTGKGVLTIEQRVWRGMWERFGGIYIEARDLSSCVFQVRRVIAKELQLESFLHSVGYKWN